MSILYPALPWISRRGPDSHQIWLAQDNNVSLLHVRLAITDKAEGANQPFSDERLNCTIVFTGEVYNYLELKQTLPNFNFRTESDTEVILAAYSAHGIAGLSILKGMYALALVDERQKKIILARDPVGKKPLFIAHPNNNVVFGSSVLAMAAVEKGLGAVNDGISGYFWENSFIPPDSSILSEVIPVFPGEVLELDWQGNLMQKTRLQPKIEHFYNGESLEEINRNISMLLNIAVRRRLTNNPRPAVLLSGGIDSTLICETVKSIENREGLPENLETLSLRSLLPLMNDEFYARYAARRIKAPLKLISPDTRRLADSIMKAFDLQDEPLGMPSFFLLERLVNAASAHRRIILTGDGGDEVFLGYGKASDWIGMSPDEGRRRLFCGPELPVWMSEWGKRTVTDVLIGNMFTKLDRASSEQAVEIRCPFLDWDLLAYARSLPHEFLLHGGRTKALLKYQLSGWPGWFLDRPKLGFAYNLRWHWGIVDFSGLRESIDTGTVEVFGSLVHADLRKPPVKWKRSDIFNHFEECWRLLAWRKFQLRLKGAMALG